MPPIGWLTAVALAAPPLPPELEVPVPANTTDEPDDGSSVRW